MPITVKQLGDFVHALEEAREAIQSDYLGGQTSRRLVRTATIAAEHGVTIPGLATVNAILAQDAKPALLSALKMVRQISLSNPKPAFNDAVKSLEYILDDLDELLARDLVRRIDEAEGETPAPAEVEATDVKINADAAQ